jgi:endonuclease/exonuclease/phosphatase family metal-dependent hydrolase
VPDDQPRDEEPRLHATHRASWLAGVAAAAVVLALAGIFWVVVWGPGSGPTSSGGIATSGGSVITASTSPAPSKSPHHHRRHRRLRDPLQPTKVHHDADCPIRPPQIISVMQFNIHAGISRYGGLGLARIAAEIRAAHPDLVSLNEVDSGTQRSDRIDEAAYLGHATGMRSVYGPNLFGYDGGRFGNAILSRFPVASSHNTRLPRRPHTEPRGVLEATVKVGHRAVSFYSVHLSQGHLRGAADRAREAEAVARVIHTSRNPTVVAGDLNSRPTDLPVRILRQYLLDAQQQGGTGSGLTVPAGDPVNRIDYILYDNHFGVVPGTTQVLPSGSSDHRSVWTELVLRPPGQC